jgi:hypothetical protein
LDGVGNSTQLTVQSNRRIGYSTANTLLYIYCTGGARSTQIAGLGTLFEATSTFCITVICNGHFYFYVSIFPHLRANPKFAAGPHKT